MTAAPGLIAPDLVAPDLIAEENARAGTTDWWPARHAPHGAIEAYTRQVSVRPGGRIELCVSTRPAARYRLAVFRLGWYHGDGARLVHAGAPTAGIPRAAPSPDPDTGLCAAGWPVTESLYIPAEWTPGQYVAQLTLTSGRHAGAGALVPFIVRRGAGAPAALLVQTGVNTTQAYNHWGGKSLYPSNSSDQAPAVKVSFDRPLPAWDEANLNARAPFHYDLAVIRFLERQGYDVGYQTNVDTHREPWTLLTATALVCAGHDEYWTFETRRGFEQARDAGIHLAFLGANQCYWQARYEDQERTLVEYRSKRNDPIKDPARKTVQWRDLDRPRPESRLLGVRYAGGITSTDELLSYEVVPGAELDRWGEPLADHAPLRGAGRLRMGRAGPRVRAP